MKTVLVAVAALFTLLFLSAGSARAEWVKLGSRSVDYKTDHDVIEVGKSEGKFTHIRIKVEEGDMIMEKIKVTFGNGDTFEPETRVEFKEGTRSRDIELPEKYHGRYITKISFIYKSEHKHDKAEVIVYGKEK